jgi:hypothetical protein
VFCGEFGVTTGVGVGIGDGTGVTIVAGVSAGVTCIVEVVGFGVGVGAGVCVLLLAQPDAATIATTTKIKVRIFNRFVIISFKSLCYFCHNIRYQDALKQDFICKTFLVFHTLTENKM